MSKSEISNLLLDFVAPHSGRRVVSLSKIHLLPKSTGNTQEVVAPSRHVAAVKSLPALIYIADYILYFGPLRSWNIF